MRDVNRVTLIGRCTHGVKLAYSQANQARLNFSIATERRWMNKQTGEWTGETEFTNCVMFGTGCEKLESRIHKGTPIRVEGYLKTREWEKDGVKHRSTEVVALEVDPLVKDDGNGGAPQQRKEYTPPAAPKAAEIDDDLPF